MAWQRCRVQQCTLRVLARMLCMIAPYACSCVLQRPDCIAGCRVFAWLLASFSCLVQHAPSPATTGTAWPAQHTLTAQHSTLSRSVRSPSQHCPYSMQCTRWVQTKAGGSGISGLRTEVSFGGQTWWWRCRSQVLLLVVVAVMVAEAEHEAHQPTFSTAIAIALIARWCSDVKW